jgi:hypothetical protein
MQLDAKFSRAYIRTPHVIKFSRDAGVSVFRAGRDCHAKLVSFEIVFEKAGQDVQPKLRHAVDYGV